MPSGKQENAPPATIPGSTNLELLKHQSENEQDFVSLLHIVISEKKWRTVKSKRDFFRVVHAQREYVLFPS